MFNFPFLAELQTTFPSAAKRVGQVMDEYSCKMIYELVRIRHAVEDQEFTEVRYRFNFIAPAGVVTTQPMASVPLGEEWELDALTIAPTGVIFGVGPYVNIQDVDSQVAYAGLSTPVGVPATLGGPTVVIPGGTDLQAVVGGSAGTTSVYIQFAQRKVRTKRDAARGAAGDRLLGPGMGRDHEAVPEWERRFTPHTLSEAINGFDDGDHRSELHSEDSNDN